MSNCGAVASSTEAFAIRIFILSSDSVERFFNRILSSSIHGGFTKTASVSVGYQRLIRNPHAKSISKITFLPFAQIRSISLFKVP